LSWQHVLPSSSGSFFPSREKGRRTRFRFAQSWRDYAGFYAGSGRNQGKFIDSNAAHHLIY
jgi:hypothetical protein